LARDDRKLDLFLSHRAALVEYAAPIVGCRARAEDVVQEAFLRFAPTGQVLESPVAYLYRIVRNLALDLTRRRAGERRHEDGAAAWWILPAAPRTPEQEMIHRQELARIERALSALPPRSRAAVALHRFEGCTLQEIANRLGVSVPTAHRLVRSALVAITRALEPSDH